jgi:hypothetical protein|tara:strand:+ start:764 stop:1192 length:429 start_codon:yes stop_codon:yes gene_type:complete
MKLKKIYLFFILLLTLFTSSLLGSCNREGYDNKEGDDNKQCHDNKEGANKEGANKEGANKEKFISSNKIPPGNEDLYILKSQIVPPVCPACPNVVACPNKKEMTPCPPCARCPEPSFDCKKVPNYTTNTDLPRPLVNDFSKF